jgi:hypothetical protein
MRKPGAERKLIYPAASRGHGKKSGLCRVDVMGETVKRMAASRR